MVRPILPKQEGRQSPGLDNVGYVRTAKRRCISSACIPCRRRKSKCDGAMPACSTCNAVYQMECVYDTDRDRLRASAVEKGSKNDTVDSLVTRLRNAPEDQVKTIVDQIRTKGTIGNTFGSRPQHDKRKPSFDYRRESEPTIVQDMGKLQIDELGDLRHFGRVSSLESIHSWPRRVSLATADDTTPVRSWSNVTSDQDLISELLNLYFTWNHPVHVLFSQSCFLSDMKKHRTKYCSPLLVNAILALASHYSERLDVRSNPADPSTAGDYFFAEAKRLLQAEEDHPSLTAAQALALMALREAGCGRDSTSWMYCGRALHIVLDLGLHLPAKLEVGTAFSLTEVEVRRITFWGLFALDKLWSMHFGRIPQLPSSIVGIPKPSIIQQLEAGPWVAPDKTGRPCHVMEIATKYAELAEVLGDALRALHSPKQRFDTGKLVELHWRLKEWRGQLPQFMDPQDDAVPAVFVLNMVYHSIVLLIFRPFRHISLSGFTETPREIGIRAAMEICTVFSSYQKAHFDAHPLVIMPHILLPAALVFLQENMDQTSNGPFDETCPISSCSLEYNLEQCILNLRKMSSTWDLSNQAFHVIWRRASSCDLPPRVKKALCSKAAPSLELIPSSESRPMAPEFNVGEDRKSIRFTCGGYLEPTHAMDGCDCLELRAGMESGSEGAWFENGGRELRMAASVAGLLGDLGCDITLGMG